MKIKRIVSLLLVLLALFSLCACSDSETEQAVRGKIQNATFYGKTISESGKGSITQVIKMEHKYWITFNEDGTCSGKHEQTSKYDDNYYQERLRDKTEKSTYDYEGKWSIKAKESEATITITYTDSVFEMPNVFTVTLDGSGKITSFVGVNEHSENLKSSFEPYYEQKAEAQ